MADAYVAMPNQSGGWLVTEGWPDGAKVETFQELVIDGVNSVHPITGKDTGYMMHFTIADDAEAVGGVMRIRVAPSIITSGHYTNVSQAPPLSARVEVFSA